MHLHGLTFGPLGQGHQLSHAFDGWFRSETYFGPKSGMTSHQIWCQAAREAFLPVISETGERIETDAATNFDSQRPLTHEGWIFRWD